jgi:hypothetical protein
MTTTMTQGAAAEIELPLEEVRRFEAWLNRFDRRHADLSDRLDALMSSLGVTFDSVKPEFSQH